MNINNNTNNNTDELYKPGPDSGGPETVSKTRAIISQIRNKNKNKHKNKYQIQTKDNTQNNTQNNIKSGGLGVSEAFAEPDIFVNNWKNEARENQKEPEGDWDVWLTMAGRGFGKTRMGAETVRKWVVEDGYRHIALVGDTESDVRSVMIEGRSGILAVHAESERPIFYSSQKLLVWPNGATARIYTSEAYEKLRGPEFDCAWVDEFAKFKNARDVWDQLNFCLRVGPRPKMLITTTPRPVPILDDLVSGRIPNTVVTKGSTYDNRENLSQSFLAKIEQLYEGTRIGRQELEGELLLDNPFGLWNRDIIENAKTETLPEKEDVERIVVAVDPAVSYGENSDETGIIVCAKTRDDKTIVLDDLSGKYSVHQWSKIVCDAYHKYEADRVIAEVNQGGDMVEHVLRARDQNIAYSSVHASRGKITRAEPIAALYEQGKVKHYRWGGLHKLEDQMLSFSHLGSNRTAALGGISESGFGAGDGFGVDYQNNCESSYGTESTSHLGFADDQNLGHIVASNNSLRRDSIGRGSPDRVDALVWAVSELMLATRDANGNLNTNDSAPGLFWV